MNIWMILVSTWCVLISVLNILLWKLYMDKR